MEDDLRRDLQRIKKDIKELSEKEKDTQAQLDEIKWRIQSLIDLKNTFLKLYPEHSWDGTDMVRCDHFCQRCEILET